MRNKFDQQLHLLNTELIEMGALIERAIESATEVLVNKDLEKAKRAVEFDANVNQKERDIEAICLKLLLQQQPVASDLRLISSALKMVTDMERIGDQAADIAEIVLMIGDEPYVKPLEHLPMMADVTKKMVTRSIDAFVARDENLAREVMQMDDEVDRLFVLIEDELIELIAKDPAAGKQAMDLLLIAKYLERIGDHAENIAEWVEFAITGVHKGEIL